MTSLTGSTAQTLRGTVTPPSFELAMCGSAAILSATLFTWLSHTSAAVCLHSLRGCAADPWGSQVALTLTLSLCLWLLSLRTIPSRGSSDPSIVDRLWSILPAVYSWHFFLRAPDSAAAERVLLMALLSTAWGVRLTWNFALKGGFSGGEDYRWAEVRAWFPGRKWEVFNFVFICLTQQLVILGFTAPAVAAMQSARRLNALDGVAAGLFLTLLVGEAVADRQMWSFQQEKYRRLAAGKPLGSYSRGFIETGLWAYSRHPNYFCEVCMWWAYYLFAVAASAQLLHWTALGPAFLTALFVAPQGSLDVTEALSSRKYAAYPEYQRRVSRFVPRRPKKE